MGRTAEETLKKFINKQKLNCRTFSYTTDESNDSTLTLGDTTIGVRDLPATMSTSMEQLGYYLDYLTYDLLDHIVTQVKHSTIPLDEAFKRDLESHLNYDDHSLSEINDYLQKEQDYLQSIPNVDAAITQFEALVQSTNNLEQHIFQPIRTLQTPLLYWQSSHADDESGYVKNMDYLSKLRSILEEAIRVVENGLEFDSYDNPHALDEENMSIKKDMQLATDSWTHLIFDIDRIKEDAEKARPKGGRGRPM